MRLILFVSILLIACNFLCFSINIDSNFSIVGTIRTKFEYNLDTNASAFVVRNARYQVSGNINPKFDYKAEIDLSDEGKIKMLDAFVNFKPIENLSLTLGQMKVPFSTDNMRSVHNIAFSNRSFISKRVSSSMRDIGGMITYDMKKVAPFKLYLGVYNGYGINTPTRNEFKNIAARIESKPIKDLQLSFCYYDGTINELNVKLFNCGLDWQYEGFVLDGEFALRQSKGDSVNLDTYSYFIYLLKHIPIDNFIFTYITPGVRFDNYEQNYVPVRQNTNRLTAGLTFTLTKIYESHIRIDYENYTFTGLADQLSDKITIEFMARF
ncbi:MAG TPA: porin [Candidatus Kapabacteria bacterium]|nr:porin [Candidatus Kapabacteria bacterium]